MYFIYLTRYDSWNYRYIIIILGSLPFLSYLTLTIIINKYFDNKKIRIIIKVCSKILLFLSLFMHIFTLFKGAILEYEHPEINIKHYSKFIKDYNLTEYFPSYIPESAKNTKFVLEPGFLQGGTTISLYYIDEKFDIKNYDNLYREKAEWMGQYNDYSEKYGLLNDLFNDNLINYIDKDNFSVYLFNSKCDDSGYCNHGIYSLLAINENTKEVLYEYQNW